MEDFCIKLAGVPVRIRCQNQSNRDFLQDYFSDQEPAFLIEPSQADLEKVQRQFDRMDQVEGSKAFRRQDAFLENNAIHALLADKLIEKGVLLVHGSALCVDGQAVVFVAPSGTGKSTHARLWREIYGDHVWMINDDKPMLKVEGDQVLVYGTPWDGKHHLSRNASAPLKAVVHVKRSGSNAIMPLSSSDAFPVLMKYAYTSDDPVLMAGIIDLEKQVIGRADFYELLCNMDPQAAVVARDGIKW